MNVPNAPNMNLNRYQSVDTCVRLLPSTVGEPVTLLYRGKPEKVADRNRLAKLGIEEDLPAICSSCWSKVRKVVRKPRNNIHYGCVKNCCVMLHQWSMCEQCIISQHFPEMLVVDERVRCVEAKKFQQIFSRLPHDIKRYIGDYVPQIFDCIKLSIRVLEDPIYGDLDKFVKLPKSVWNAVSHRMVHEYATYERLTVSTSRQKVCDEVRKLYDRIYKEDKEIIRDHDYWTEYHFNGVFRQHRMASVAQDIKPMLITAKK